MTEDADKDKNDGDNASTDGAETAAGDARTDRLRELIQRLSDNPPADPTPLLETLTGLLRRDAEGTGAPVDLLVELLGASQTLLRRAAVAACGGRHELPVLGALAKLAADDDYTICVTLLDRIAELPPPLLATTLEELLTSDNSALRARALKVAASRGGYGASIRRSLQRDDDWEVRQLAAQVIDRNDTENQAALLTALATDSDEDVAGAAADQLEPLLATSAPAALRAASIETLEKAAESVSALDGDKHPRLAAWLRERTESEVNPKRLTEFGTDLTEKVLDGTLPRAFGVGGVCDQVIDALRERRSVVLLGPAGCGKSAIVAELAHRLVEQQGEAPWRVLRVSPADIMAGTLYLGEWQTRLRSLAQAVRRPRRVLLYIPNLEELAGVGKSANSDSNVGSALAPYLEDRSVVILGESTDAAYDRGTGASGSLRRLFDTVRVPEMTVAATRATLTEVRDHAGSKLADERLDQIAELASYYLGNQARPGNAVGLLRLALELEETSSEPLTARDLLYLLSASTGIPVDLLDDHVALRLPEVRAFFEARVMGQPEAVRTVVDLVTLIKSGLTDPARPFGVLLFVGPTGVGKTELARSLAEYIFGDAARLKRFDMSEFANYSSFERLIGHSGSGGLLTEAVQREPFSVVLLDEIEKAHGNVFDLCLQLFDAGRLRDGRGRTVDFRRTVLILTSNVGATSPADTKVGFGADGGPAHDRDHTFRELTRFFRPEFLNRLDHIVNFRPLSIEVAEKIARRELDRVLRRKGIARRQLAIDVDPAVVSELVKAGYSPHFGARPLKRAVEQRVLLPVGRTIATGKLPERGVLRLRWRGNAVECQIVAEEEPAEAVDTAPPEAGIIERVQALLDGATTLRERARDLDQSKSKLLAESRTPERADDRGRIYEDVRRIERLSQTVHGLGNALENLERRLERQGVDAAQLPELHDRVDQFAAELQQLDAIVDLGNLRDGADALLCLTLVDGQGESLGAVERLAKMYLALARRRHLDAVTLAEHFVEQPLAEAVYLQLSGLGAFRLLAGESGLHQVHRRSSYRHAHSKREKQRREREVVRVDVLPAPLDERLPLAHCQIRARSLTSRRGRVLERAAWEVELLHRPSLLSLEATAGGSREQAVASLQRIVIARDDSPLRQAGEQNVVRRYHIGSAPLVKDYRSGRSTPQVDRVLNGHLDSFLEFTPETR